MSIQTAGCTKGHITHITVMRFGTMNAFMFGQMVQMVKSFVTNITHKTSDADTDILVCSQIAGATKSQVTNITDIKCVTIVNVFVSTQIMVTTKCFITNVTFAHWQIQG